MKQSTSILRGMNDIRADYILESELPDMATAPTMAPRSTARETWQRITSSGWFVAAVCAIVAFGTLAGIIWAGQGGPGVVTPAGTLPPVTTTEQTEQPTEAETEPAIVYTEGLEYAPVDGEDGVCYVVGIGQAKDKRIRIPETSPDGLTVKYVGYQAFAYNMDIVEVTLPDTVESISSYAFIACMSLKKVTIGEGLTTVNDYAFYQCTELKDINLNTDHQILTSAMYGTPWLDAHTDEFVIYGGNLIDYNGVGGDVIIPEGILKIYGSTFEGNTSITSVTVPDSCTYMAGPVFAGCTALEEVIIPSSVITMGAERMFEGCTSLRHIELPGVIELIAWAFKDAPALESVVMPEAMYIGFETFKNCTSLVSIETSALKIGRGCFTNCTSLKEIILHDGVQILSQDFFMDCTALERIVVPTTVTEIGSISAIPSENLVIEYAGTAEDFAKIQMDEQTAAILLPYVQFAISE